MPSDCRVFLFSATDDFNLTHGWWKDRAMLNWMKNYEKKKTQFSKTAIISTSGLTKEIDFHSFKFLSVQN